MLDGRAGEPKYKIEGFSMFRRVFGVWCFAYTYIYIMFMQLCFRYFYITAWWVCSWRLARLNYDESSPIGVFRNCMRFILINFVLWFSFCLWHKRVVWGGSTWTFLFYLHIWNLLQKWNKDFWFWVHCKNWIFDGFEQGRLKVDFYTRFLRTFRFYLVDWGPGYWSLLLNFEGRVKHGFHVKDETLFDSFSQWTFMQITPKQTTKLKFVLYHPQTPPLTRWSAISPNTVNNSI